MVMHFFTPFSQGKDETISRKYWGKKSLFLPQILTVFRLRTHRQMGLSCSAPPSSNFLMFKKENFSSRFSRGVEGGSSSGRLRSCVPASQAPPWPQEYFRILPGAPAGRKPRPLVNSKPPTPAPIVPSSLMNILEPSQEHHTHGKETPPPHEY